MPNNMIAHELRAFVLCRALRSFAASSRAIRPSNHDTPPVDSPAAVFSNAYVSIHVYVTRERPAMLKIRARRRTDFLLKEMRGVSARTVPSYRPPGRFR